MGEEPTFRQLLHRVREVTLGAYAHQDLPFEKLLEDLQPQRDMSYTPLFQVMLVFQNTPQSEADGTELNVKQLGITENSHSHFDMTLWMLDSAEGITGELQYNTDLFEQETILRVIDNLQNLLEGIVTNPDQPITMYPLLNQAQKDHLRRWHQSSLALPPVETIQALFEKHVVEQPEAIAVVWQDQHLSYAELDQQANQLSTYLQALGVGPEARVGVYLERSPQMIVAVMAVLKAGGAYIPIDPAYPLERVSMMIDDSRPHVLLTQTKLQDNLSDFDLTIAYIDQDRPRLSSQKPVCRASKSNLAYIVYTSGSTGRPKGVMVTHHTFINAYEAWADQYNLEPGMNHLQMASFSFDVFSGDFARALCSGGTLVLCPREALLMPDELYTLLNEQNIHCGEFVPAVVKPLLHYLTTENLSFPPLKNLIVGSDLWLMNDFQQLKERCSSDTRLINSYGLSEATIDSTYFEHHHHPLPPDKAVPIGYPFPNTQIYILDANLQMVPIGVVGELYVGGEGLARGYHNDSVKTASKFIPNPFRVHSEKWLFSESQIPHPTSRIPHPESKPLTPNPQTLTPNSRLYKTGGLGALFT